MTTYPGAIDEFRTTQNIPGILYDPDDTKTVFAEDTNNHSTAIVAIETELGTNPAGASATVADRMNALDTTISEIIPDQSGNSGKFLSTDGSVLSWQMASGGGGPIELVYEDTLPASAVSIGSTALDLDTDKFYYIIYNVIASTGNVFVKMIGAGGVTNNWRGMEVSPGSVGYRSSAPAAAGASEFGGMGAGTATISLNAHGYPVADLNMQRGLNYRFDMTMTTQFGTDAGKNITGFIIDGSPSGALAAGSWIKIYKVGS